MRIVSYGGMKARRGIGHSRTQAARRRPVILESARRTELYGLNTLMKRQPPGATWEMLEVTGDARNNVPRGGSCKQGDCAMVVVLD